VEGVVRETGEESEDGENPIGDDGQGEGGVRLDVRVYGIEAQSSAPFKSEGRVFLSWIRSIETRDGAMVKIALDHGFAYIAVRAGLDGVASPIED
jgi:hypothetical protein